MVKASRAHGGKRDASDSTVAPERRAPKADFSSSLCALQGAVRKACAGQSEWEAKIAAGASQRDFPKERLVLVALEAWTRTDFRDYLRGLPWPSDDDLARWATPPPPA